MKVTITNMDGDFFTLEVSEDMELENFKAFCEIESGVPANRMYLMWNGNPLQDNKRKLNDYGIQDGDMILVQRAHGTAPNQARPQASRGGLPPIDFSQIQIPGMPGAAASSSGPRPSPDDPAALRELLLNSPHDLALLKERNPPLADALLSNSLEKFTEVLQKQQGERMERERDRIRLLTADPFDHEAQQKIAEEIRLKNVESNMETAMEYAPESFGQVVMLYVDCMVNGQPVKAFVDSGAQMTIMSQACAERCNIMRLVDSRWAGIAKGVGTQKILGRVHLCQIQIGPDFLQSSFSILENQPMDMLLGLDMLKRHQCSIDLKRNVLVIGTTGTETPFLAEGDLPDHARLNRQSSENPDEDRQLAEALAKSAQETQAAASGASASATTSQPSHSFPESSIGQITVNGFSRQQAIEELTKSGGDPSKALVALLAKSFKMP